jgi:3-oxo-5-alpha-steroid 4-dehydrogenase 1
MEIEEKEFFNYLLKSWIGLGIIVFFILSFGISAPYGRHSRSGWGFTINNKLCWMLMEIPSPILLFLCFLFKTQPINELTFFFFFLWELHYINRSIIFPLRIPSSNQTMNFSIFITSLFFNIINGYLNGRYLFTFCSPNKDYPITYIYNKNFIIGFLLFFIGMFINIQSDNILIKLKKSIYNEKKENSSFSYKIPYGGLFDYISSPNYFGECIEWFGFWLMTLNWSSFSFFLWTVANLAPRAYSHHLWYKKTFSENYPKSRKALIPFIF